MSREFFFAEKLVPEHAGRASRSGSICLRFAVDFEWSVSSRSAHILALENSRDSVTSVFCSLEQQICISWQTLWYESKTCLFATENVKNYEKRHLLITLREQNKQTWHVTAVLSRNIGIECLLSKPSLEYRRSTLIATVNAVESSGWSVLCSNQRDSERRSGVVKNVTGVFRCCKS